MDVNRLKGFGFFMKMGFGLKRLEVTLISEESLFLLVIKLSCFSALDDIGFTSSLYTTQCSNHGCAEYVESLPQPTEPHQRFHSVLLA